MEKKVDVRELAFGMYVSRLDRPWLETPFLLQGLLIKDAHDIELLREHCRYVYIDTECGNEGAGELESHAEAPGAARLSSDLPPPQTAYEDTCSVEEEMETATSAHRQVCEVVSDLMDHCQNPEKINVESVKGAVDRMAESILRNPDALLWLRQLKSMDTYTYRHAVDAAVLAVAFARHMGLSREDIHDIGIGALLFDIGKMALPREVLLKPGPLTEQERSLVQKHVNYGVKMLKNVPGISKRVLIMTATHHERYDGKGYPRRLTNTEIPVFGRMAAIVDYFDAVTSDRAYAKAISAHEAIRELYKLRNKAFQDELVEQFIQMLGVYPSGTLVELNTGEVGVVISQNRVRRLRPRVMLILDTQKQPFGMAPVVDLLHETHRQGKVLYIERSLQPGEHGIDPREFYL